MERRREHTFHKDELAEWNCLSSIEKEENKSHSRLVLINRRHSDITLDFANKFFKHKVTLGTEGVI